MISRSMLKGAALAVALTAALPGAASAKKIVGSYEGVISAGSAMGGFGYAQTTNLAGQIVRGTFEYDTDDFGNACVVAPWAACALGSGLVITQTVNGVTETFVSTLPAVLEHPLNNAHGGIDFYNLTYESAQVAVYGFLGAPTTRSRNYWASVSSVLPTGAIADVKDLYATYSGPGGGGASSVLSGLGFGEPNQTRILELTAGDLTMNVDFSFDVRSFTMGPAGVPEPATWALMLGGFGLAGAALRSRRAQAAALVA